LDETHERELDCIFELLGLSHSFNINLNEIGKVCILEEISSTKISKKQTQINKTGLPALQTKAAYS